MSALVRDFRLASASGRDGAAPRRLVWGGAAVAGLAILVMAIVQFGWETNNCPHLRLSVVASAERLIPPGACLLADEVSFAVMTNRLVSDVPGCSLLLDSTGTNYAYSHGRDPETGAARYPEGGRGVDLRLRPRPVRVAVRAEQAPGGLDAAAAGATSRPTSPGS